eukprot:465034-Amphidinium_carterae.2
MGSVVLSVGIAQDSGPWAVGRSGRGGALGAVAAFPSACRSPGRPHRGSSHRWFAPTLCDVRGAPWHERLAMGGWREQPADQQQRQQARNLMPA